MTDNWGNDPIVSNQSPHADWGNDPVVGGERMPSKSPAVAAPSDPLRSKLPSGREPAVAPPSPIDEEAGFNRRRELESSLKAQGIDPRTNAEWQGLVRQVGQAEADKPRQFGVLMAPTGMAGKGFAGTAEKIGQKALGFGADAKGVASRVMPGATAKAQGTVSQIGPVTDIEALGQKMQSDLGGKVQQQMAAQEKSAPAIRKLKADYMSQPPEVEKAILADARDAVLQLRSKMTRITDGQAKIMKEAVEDLSRDPSMENIEATRKDLASIAKYGRPDQGVKSAVDRAFAQQLSGILEKSVRQRVPSAAKYIDSANASEELRDFTKSGEPLKADKFFGTKDGIDKLRRLSGGDEKFVSDSARAYSATQLEGKDVSAAKEWMTKNDAWLSELPQVKSAVNDYVSNLDKIASTRQKAWQLFKKSALGAAGVYGLSKAKQAVGLMENFVP